jgi:hypothetical protein
VNTDLLDGGEDEAATPDPVALRGWPAVGRGIPGVVAGTSPGSSARKRSLRYPGDA